MYKVLFVLLLGILTVGLSQPIDNENPHEPGRSPNEISSTPNNVVPTDNNDGTSNVDNNDNTGSDEGERTNTDSIFSNIVSSMGKMLFGLKLQFFRIVEGVQENIFGVNVVMTPKTIIGKKFEQDNPVSIETEDNTAADNGTPDKNSGSQEETKVPVSNELISSSSGERKIPLPILPEIHPSRKTEKPLSIELPPSEIPPSTSPQIPHSGLVKIPLTFTPKTLPSVETESDEDSDVEEYNLSLDYFRKSLLSGFSSQEKQDKTDEDLHSPLNKTTHDNTSPRLSTEPSSSVVIPSITTDETKVSPPKTSNIEDNVTPRELINESVSPEQPSPLTRSDKNELNTHSSSDEEVDPIQVSDELTKQQIFEPIPPIHEDPKKTSEPADDKTQSDVNGIDEIAKTDDEDKPHKSATYLEEFTHSFSKLWNNFF